MEQPRIRNQESRRFYVLFRTGMGQALVGAKDGLLWEHAEFKFGPFTYQEARGKCRFYNDWLEEIRSHYVREEA